MNKHHSPFFGFSFLNGSFLTRHKSLLFSLVLGMVVLVLLTGGFLSCAPPDTGRLGSTTGPGGGTSTTPRRTGPSDEEEDAEECTSNETCEMICETVYPESWAACNDLDIEAVTAVNKVFNRLNANGHSKSRLEDISDESGGISVEHFKTYLETGVDSWIEEITRKHDATKPGPGYDKGDARDTIEWLIDNDNVSEVLNNVDEGNEILKALIEKAIRVNATVSSCPASDVCLFRINDSFYPSVPIDLENKRSNPWIYASNSEATATNPHRGAIQGHITVTATSGTNKLEIRYYGDRTVDLDGDGNNEGPVTDGCSIKSWCPTVADSNASCNTDGVTGNCVPKWSTTCNAVGTCDKVTPTRDHQNSRLYTIQFDDRDDQILYRDLSAAWAYPGKRDIFTAAENKGNAPLFHLSFKLLDEVCENIDDGDTEDKTACRKAMMCILAMHEEHTKGHDDVISKSTGESRIEDWDGWGMVRELDLEDKLGDDYDECTKDAFDEDNLD